MPREEVQPDVPGPTDDAPFGEEQPMVDYQESRHDAYYADEYIDDDYDYYI